MPEVYRDLLTCVVCDKGGDSIKKCAKCFSVSYCGRECQVGDWARHKRLCDPVMVKDFGEKGRGLVASKNFKAKDLIFKDISVTSVPVIIDDLTPIYVDKCGKEVYAQISKLSDADKKDFFELSGSAIIEVLLSQHTFKSNPENKKLRALSIYLNNRTGIFDENNAHVYLKYSRMNHSCDPNTVWDATDSVGKRVELRAIKEIKVGEEVTTSYLDPHTAILGEKKEKEPKLENWAFQCKCDICLQPETDQIKKLRNEYKILEKKMQEPVRDIEKTLPTLDQLVDFIIKLDNPFLSFSPGSIKFYCELARMGKLAGRLDIQKKATSLLKKYVFGDVDKYLLRHDNDMKMMIQAMYNF